MIMIIEGQRVRVKNPKKSSIFSSRVKAEIEKEANWEGTVHKIYEYSDCNPIEVCFYCGIKSPLIDWFEEEDLEVID